LRQEVFRGSEETDDAACAERLQVISVEFFPEFFAETTSSVSSEPRKDFFDAIFKYPGAGSPIASVAAGPFYPHLRRLLATTTLSLAACLFGLALTMAWPDHGLTRAYLLSSVIIAAAPARYGSSRCNRS